MPVPVKLDAVQVKFCSDFAALVLLRQRKQIRPPKVAASDGQRQKVATK